MKQSTIFHITLLRVLSPQQLAPADVAAVQAAVDAAAAPLVGLRFVPRHMLCGPAADAHEHGEKQVGMGTALLLAWPPFPRATC